MRKVHKNYDEATVIRQLNQKHDILIKSHTREIKILVGNEAKGDIGIHSKGKIDFLVNFREYRKVNVTSLTEKKAKVIEF